MFARPLLIRVGQGQTAYPTAACYGRMRVIHMSRGAMFVLHVVVTWCHVVSKITGQQTLHSCVATLQQEGLLKVPPRLHELLPGLRALLT